MRLQRVFAVLTAMLLLLALPMGASAQDEMSFFFELTVDGKDTKEAEPGDIITVVLKLKREDADESFVMYAMQDEIRYDSSYFELVSGSTILNQGITTTDIAMVDRYREFYMNYLSMNGGNQWNTQTMVGSFQLRVIGTSGITKITNEDFLVSSQDGTYSYPCRAGDITVILSRECTVTFETDGGTPVPEQLAEFGMLLTRPEDPVKEGFHLEGWYTDPELTKPWDFAVDTVQENMTLYARWAEGDPAGDTPDSPGFLMPAVAAVLAAGAAVAAALLQKKKRTENAAEKPRDTDAADGTDKPEEPAE